MKTADRGCMHEREKIQEKINRKEMILHGGRKNYLLLIVLLTFMGENTKARLIETLTTLL